MIKLNYGNRSITWGNEALITADYDRTGEAFKNIELITGMVKAKAMEDKGSVTNFPADDMADHGSKRGASILEGELTLIQADPTFKVSMLGHIKSENGFGTVPTGNYPKKAVQWVRRMQRKNKTTNALEQGYQILVYPNVQATGEITSESETDSQDGADAIEYVFPIQATASDFYAQTDAEGNSVYPPEAIYEVWGSDATAFEAKLTAGLFIFEPDTVLAAGTGS